MIDLFGTSFCLDYKDLDRTEVKIDKVGKLFSSALSNKNVFLFDNYSFFFVELVPPHKNTNGSLTPSGYYVNKKDRFLLAEVSDYMEKFGWELCRKGIERGYLKYANDQSIVKFYTVEKTPTLDCNVVAVNFLKQFTNKIGYLYKFKMIYSILICSAPINKNIPINNGRDMIVKNPSFASYLSYQSAKWAFKNGYHFYFIMAADMDLVRMYQKWGFHFGLPYLKLDLAIDVVTSDEFFEYTILERIPFKEAVKEEIVYAINQILCRSWRTANIVLDMKKREWENILAQFPEESMPFREQATDLMTEMLRGESFAMYIDLHSEDITNLKEYSKSRMVSYFL